MSQLSNNDGNFSVYRQDSTQHYYCRWTAQEDALLKKAVKEVGPKKWMLISNYIPGRTAVQCSARWSGALNPSIHKGRWSKIEDQALIKAVNHFQNSMNIQSSSLPWNAIAQHIPYRTGIQCQARWTEALDPSVRKGRWYPEEDVLLQEAVRQCGCCWIRVASMIPTRTQRQCRTRWNQMQSRQSKLKASSNSDGTSHYPLDMKRLSKSPKEYEDDFNEVLAIDSSNTTTATTATTTNATNNINNTYSSYMFPSQVSTNLFTLDDMLAQGIQFQTSSISTSSSRMGSISSDPPTPVDQKNSNLNSILSIPSYQTTYYANINHEFALPIEFDSVFNCFTSQ